MTLKEDRIKSHLTQEEVAKKAGLTNKFISDIETGKRNASDKTKMKLAQVYKVNPRDIFLAACELNNN